MGIDEVKRIVKITESKEKVILSELGDDLEIINPMYEDLAKSEVSSVSGGDASYLTVLENPLLGKFLILSEDEKTGNTYLASKKTNDNLQLLLCYNARIYEQAKEDVLEVLELTESDYQSKLIEKIRSEIDEFNNK